MKILVIGKGGREHAIAWKFKNSPKVSEVFVAPGNDGMKDVAKTVEISETDAHGLVKFALENNIDMTFVGPESSLSVGVADAFQKHGLKVFGPTQKAAMIESSKSFCKYIMDKYDIPTADYKECSSYDEALEYVKSEDVFPIVLKVDGLAAGKGVMIPETLEECESYLKDIFTDKKFGEQTKIVVEEFLEGEEFSQLAFVHETNVIPMQIAQDHKRALDGDKGENTGGMGAYTPVSHISNKEITEGHNICQKMADALVKEGIPFTGILYAGLMITKNGVKVIEFNARFGDPETEVLLPAMETDLVDIIEATLMNQKINIEWSKDHFIGVVLASKGYPASYESGKPLDIMSLKGDELVFSMGVKDINGVMSSNGGRVAIVVGNDSNLNIAKKKVYLNIERLATEDFVFRKDIGHRSK